MRAVTIKLLFSKYFFYFRNQRRSILSQGPYYPSFPYDCVLYHMCPVRVSAKLLVRNQSTRSNSRGRRKHPTDAASAGMLLQQENITRNPIQGSFVELYGVTRQGNLTQVYRL